MVLSAFSSSFNDSNYFDIETSSFRSSCAIQVLVLSIHCKYRIKAYLMEDCNLMKLDEDTFSGTAHCHAL